MNADQNTLERQAADNSALPAPHRCPWIVQYLLVSPLRRIVEPPAKLVGSYVKPGMTVLEPGCGFGYVSLALARLVGDHGLVISVDVEPRAVERLKRRAKRAKVSARIDARPCPARDLGLSEFNAKVDLVTVIHTLHEFEDLPGFLAQIKSLLKPTGRMLVVEPRGHVRPEHFEAELQVCQEAGFRIMERPTLGGKRMAALLQPMTTN